ncbi:MAG: PLP-dependent aminotransferase family protein [Blastochloris sp.]|nr:PLP-dependent aminotransferase family protein [Blastochloris sp.]
MAEKDYRPHEVCLEVGLLGFMRQVGQPGLINLAAGVPAAELLPVEGLKRAFRKATQELGRGMWVYQTPEGHGPLRETLAHRLRGRGVKLAGSDVLITTGCTQALHLAIRAVAGPGDVVACESPCYYNTLEQIAGVGARALPLPMSRERGLWLEEAEVLLKRHRPKAMVLCSTLSNPSGASIAPRDRRKWVEMARRLGVTIIEDDIYAELSDGRAPKPLRAYDDGSTVLYVTSYCKSVSPGLRVGCAVPGRWFESMVAMKCQADLHGSLLSEATLDAFLKSPDMEKHGERLKEVCRRKRAKARGVMEACFPEGTEISRSEGGFMLWVELPERRDLKAVSEKALRRGVSFARGEVFSCVAPQRSGMRINCAKVTEEELVRGLEILGECLA